MLSGSGILFIGALKREHSKEGRRTQAAWGIKFNKRFSLYAGPISSDSNISFYLCACVCTYICICVSELGTHAGGKRTSSVVSPHLQHCWGQGLCCLPLCMPSWPTCELLGALRFLSLIVKCWDYKRVPLSLASHASWGFELKS